MKKQVMTAITVITLFAVLPGCKKVFDYINDNPAGDYTDCQVKNISWPNGLKLTIHYNKYGNPDSSTFSTTSTEHRNIGFRYDNQKRLIESWQYYPQGGVQFWSKYKYDNSGRIASDSTWDGGILVNGKPQLEGYETLKLQSYVYDAKGRIKDILIYYPEENSHDQIEYWYDENDNRDFNENVVEYYDNKMNIHRTHKVFMFIDRNYSLNNPVGATAYNSNHLPTKFGTTNRNYFLNANLQNSTVTYKCK